MKNKYEIVGDYVIIFIKRNNREILECYVDLDDFNSKLKYENTSWHARYSKSADTYYAQTKIKGRIIHMHRLLFNLPMSNWRTIVPDHLDHNGLNNRRDNVRIKTKEDNHFNIRRMNPRNTSGTRGVTFVKATNKWMAQIQVNRKCISMQFSAKEDAIEYAKKLYEMYAN